LQSVEERNAYVRHMENLRCQRSVIMTGYDDGLQDGRAEGGADVARAMLINLHREKVEVWQGDYTL